ncbi:MAG: hypothetical protein EOP91_11520 [Lysobacteraceae bacterium]|nr:MAG: hypothetical protein EOP91_11520 [Xanthomonadaceae bacterium]
MDYPHLTLFLAGDARREWKSPVEFVLEVSEARICDGVHFRSSTEVAREMGRKVGELSAARLLPPPPDGPGASLLRP